MKLVHQLLFGLHVFVGIGAVVGGLAAIVDPQEPAGISSDILINSPFSNFLIPGIILFAVIGLGNIFSAVMFRYKLNFQGYLSGVLGMALIIWIVVQCIMLNSIVFLHVFYFVIGIIQAALSWSIITGKSNTRFH